MARKKKSTKSDARGYSQGPAASAPKQQQERITALKQETHHHMKELLDEFNPSTKTPSSVAAPSDRFQSKLSNIIDKLFNLGFTESQIEQSVLELQYEITLEGALDYLCLNVPTLELPALFTEGSLREDLKSETTAGSLVVLNEKIAGAAALHDIRDEREFENVLAISKVVKQEKYAEDERSQQKEWLLKQYEYEEDDQEDVTGTDTIADTQHQPLTPEEQQLLENEKQLKELEDDLNNDANNYMRSKQEIKALQIQVNKTRQQVAGLKRKVDRAKVIQKKEQQQQEKANADDEFASNKEDDQDENNGGFFDLFGQTQQDDEILPVKEKTQQPKQSSKLLDFSVPKGWSGTTPEKKLDEVCRKQKLLKPKYTKLPRNEGFRLSVALAKKQPPVEWDALSNDFLPGSSLRDYLAAHALYAIDSTLPLYQLFPPAFRRLWMSWENEKMEEKDQAKQERDDVKQQRLVRLVSLIEQLQHSKQAEPDGTAPAGLARDESCSDDLTTENWDDEDTNEHNPGIHAKPSSLGKKLKREFIERQSTAPYLSMKATRDNLPMSSFRQQILDTVRDNPVTILCAETGAGKTTQCPQYILEEALLGGNADRTQIICTQPRRVAATSVSERVSEEMCDTLGNVVGYQIRMDYKKSAQTKLLFCTTGVVLRRLQDDPDLSGITHVIVDEAHERQQQTDVLLIILRTLLNTKRPDLKVVLMSATLDSELFCSFFNGAPLISVPGRAFPVKNFYLEDLIEATGHVIEEGSKYAKFESGYTEQTSIWVTQRGGEKHREVVDLKSSTEQAEVSSMYESYSMSTRRSMERVNEEIINFDLIEDVLTLLLAGDQLSQAFNAQHGVDLSSGSILVFLPGFGEINTMSERLEGSRSFNSRHFEIVPMHSSLSPGDQRRAFVPTKLRKIILSTNIAETSVTVPDVVCVLDTGRVKELRQNKRFLTSQLATDWCSKASAKQRAGRAGRVQAGICLKLYSSDTANRVMQPASLPELQRVPLEEICVSILASGFAKSCSEFLSQAPQPPSNENIQAALTVLHDIGAIERDEKTEKKQTEILSPFGQHLAKLPVNVRLGKMLILASLFNCIDPVLTITASLSSQSPFSTFVKDAAIAKTKQRAFQDPNSDFMTFCNVWSAYSKANQTAAGAGKKFCHEHYLNHVSLREIDSTRRQFVKLLSSIGFLDCSMITSKDGRIDEQILKMCSFNKQSKKLELVHAIIAAGLYPNVARLDQSPGFDYTMFHRDERLYFHQTSVNASKKRYSTAEKWVVYDEKFGSSKRTSVSTTCFTHPLALILFGGKIVVKHIDRLVIVDDWIEIKMAAQTGVMAREIKKQVDAVLQKIIHRADAKEINQLETRMIEGLSRILATSQ